MTVRYCKDKTLQAVKGDWPFRFTTDWYNYQMDFVNGLDLAARADELLYTDRARFSEVKLYDNKYPISENAEIRLYGGKIVVLAGEETYEFPFDKVSTVSVLGKNKVNIYHDGKLYQMKGNERFNGVKFVQLCYRYKNIVKGEENGGFLGI